MGIGHASKRVPTDAFSGNLMCKRFSRGIMFSSYHVFGQSQYLTSSLHVLQRLGNVSSVGRPLWRDSDMVAENHLTS
jgi:hypothetical protein